MTDRRHRWVRLEPHEYVCRKCGTRRTNEEVGPNHWQSVWSGPDGRREVTPGILPWPCAEGPETESRLRLYAEAIDAFDDARFSALLE